MSETMRVMKHNRYGSPEVLHPEQVLKPVPNDDQILIKIHYTTVSSGDVRLRSFEVGNILFKFFGRLYFGITGPRNGVLGTEIAGIVEQVGVNVDKFQVGDQVFGFPGEKQGGNAEYICMDQNGQVLHLPQGLSMRESVVLPFGWTTAVYFLRDLIDLKEGQKILINGASGSVGTASVQYAKLLGAEVYAVCSGANRELVTSLGADHVIDYVWEDYTECGVIFDAIFDTVGKITFNECQDLLKPDGVYTNAVMELGDIYSMIKCKLFGGKQIVSGVVNENVQDLIMIREFAENGQATPVIDQVYEFDDIVQAHAYVDTGRKKGNVILVVDHNH
eukprot:TRINITY_DN4840_c0_g2_i1.p1 TRINITY_DN4840_c0_g2~~TRINITY_DN4840_c0_g2_i1.p1  ORF type:complete len:333 (+),score=63.28 TRINITY_DN4840_c0_g2_i1:61-1059(+)